MNREMELTGNVTLLVNADCIIMLEIPIMNE